MSWGEVKKINSDLNVPLNERMGYVGGVIPRGAIKKVIQSNTPRAKATILDISGKGVVDKVELAVSSLNNWNAAGSILVYIDGELLFTISDSYSVPSGSRTTSVKYDVNSCVCSDYKNIEVGKENILNLPLIFNKSLKIVHNSQSSNANGGSSAYDTAYITYGLY